MRFGVWALTTMAAAAGAVWACNVPAKSGAAVEAIQSIHHSGKILLWWSPDSAKYYVKICESVVPDQKIDTLDAMSAACKGTTAALETSRAILQPMLVQIASEDAGFKAVLKDEGKIAVLKQIKADVAAGNAASEGIKVGLSALDAQLADFTASLEKVQKSLANMQASADAAAQAAGHPATSADIEIIFGPAYSEALKARDALSKSQTDTKASVTEKLAAYAAVQTAIASAIGKLDALAQATLDRIAVKDAVFTVSLLQKENFEFALLESAAMRLGLLASHAPESVTCPQVCATDSPFADTARCYSCRCKEALGPLPGPDEISCANAKQMTLYKLKPATPDGYDLEELTADADSCWNASLLYGDCQYGSKLGQLTKGNTHYKWICRHRSSPDMTDQNATYDDVGVIGQNMETGASCWWDDYGNTISDKHFPKLDLTQATQAEVDDFKTTFYNTTGEGCTGCHDNDPFMYSPYLRSTGWKTEGYTQAKFATVQYDGSLKKVGHAFLAADDAAECTGCHRIASSSTCASWAKQSFGVQKGPGFEPLVAAAIDHVDADGIHTAGPNWQVAYWMPPVKTFFKGTWDKWHEKNGLAKATILKCCANPKADGCKWVDADGMPSDPDGTLQQLPHGPVAPPQPQAPGS